MTRKIRTRHDRAARMALLEHTVQGSSFSCSRENESRTGWVNTANVRAASRFGTALATIARTIASRPFGPNDSSKPTRRIPIAYCRASNSANRSYAVFNFAAGPSRKIRLSGSCRCTGSFLSPRHQIGGSTLMRPGFSSTRDTRIF